MGVSDTQWLHPKIKLSQMSQMECNMLRAYKSKCVGLPLVLESKCINISVQYDKGLIICWPADTVELLED